MITEEFRIYKHCDESCDHCNPETSICELLKMEVIPYQKCILEHKREVPLSTKSDTKRTQNICMNCRHAEFDEEEKPYCIIGESVECTSDVMECDSFDPIFSSNKHRKRIT